MKILVAFVGHMRSFMQTKDHIADNLIGPLGADTALFTRTTVGFATSDGPRKMNRPDKEIASFREHFKPIVAESLPCRHLPCGFVNAGKDVRRWADDRDIGMKLGGLGWWRSSMQSVLNMFELMSYASRHISKYASRYDIIIRTRPDLEFKSAVDPGPIHALKNRDKVILKPPFCNIGCVGGMNDQFFAGKPESILPLMNISSRLPAYAAQNVSIQPEVMLGHHLRQLGLKAEDIPVDYIIRRASGKKTDQRGAKD